VTDIDIELPALFQIVVLGITALVAKILWRRPIWIGEERTRVARDNGDPS
jgi:hypothetical protein